MTDEPPILAITDRARQQVLEIRSNETDGENLALWLEVRMQPGGGFAYDLWFQPVAEAGSGDLVQHHDDLTFVVPADSVDKVRGATLDLSGDGLMLQNPNEPAAPPPAAARPAAAEVPESDLSGPVAQAVLRVLEESINPSIAAHGGHAQLVAVEDDAAYLRLGGGCVGCGMASVTLSQGIEVAIRDAVPEINRVVDVTDHASGTNPYYEAAKK
jgi:Fe/S biogenesis protein NfuA